MDTGWHARAGPQALLVVAAQKRLLADVLEIEAYEVVSGAGSRALGVDGF